MAVQFIGSLLSIIGYWVGMNRASPQFDLCCRPKSLKLLYNRENFMKSTFGSMSTFSIASKVSSPSIIFPNTVYFMSSVLCFAYVRKNCDFFLFFTKYVFQNIEAQNLLPKSDRLETCEKILVWIWARVCHAENSAGIVTQIIMKFILEGLAPYRHTTLVKC